jgi:hypothetical protein
MWRNMSRLLQDILISERQYDVAQDLDFAYLIGAHGDLYKAAIKKALDHDIATGQRVDYGEGSQLFDATMEELFKEKLRLELLEYRK